MSFLGQDFGSVFEPKSVKEGEYQLRVLSCELKDSPKTGGSYIMARFEIIGENTAKDLNHVMMLPTPQDDVKQRNNRLANIQAFVQACGFNPADDLQIDEFIGATCWAILSEKDDPEYGMQNKVKRFVTGK